jgi:hypothetical protein
MQTRGGSPASLSVYLSISFDAVFDCTAAGGSSTGFSTGCEHTPTHWKQTALYLAAPVQLAAGDTVSGTVSFARDAAYKRSYNISVIYAHNGKHVATQMWGMQ